jgi:hypothetical protein
MDRRVDTFQARNWIVNSPTIKRPSSMHGVLPIRLTAAVGGDGAHCSFVHHARQIICHRCR